METSENVRALQNGDFAEFALENEFGKYKVLVSNWKLPIISLIYSNVESARTMYNKLNNPSDNISDDNEDKLAWHDLNKTLGSIGKLHEISEEKKEDAGKYIIAVSANTDNKEYFINEVVRKMSNLNIIPNDSSKLLES